MLIFRSPIPHFFCLVALGSSVFTSASIYGETITVDGSDLTIDGSNSPLDKYRVLNGFTLTANGATTQNIVATGSKVVLNGSTLNGTGSSIGLGLASSKATITDSFINSTGVGLQAAGSSSGIGSSADIFRSTITGVTRGATVDHFSSLNLSETKLVATRADGVGLEVFNGKVNAVASTITGGLNGIQVIDVFTVGNAVINLDSSTVVGQGGAAIVVDNFGLGTNNAQINVFNGSTLSGANGVLLDVLATASATLKISDSNTHLVGDVIAASGAKASVILDNQATLTGRLNNLESLTINNQAQWVMVEDGTVADMSMNGGSVKFGDPSAYYTLSVGNLSGNGAFHMASDFSTGETDKLDVTGTATGDHQLVVTSSGADPINADKLYLVHTAAGDAKFSLLNDRVDVGAYSYELASTENSGATDWYLNPESKTISPGAESVMALFNTAPTVWYGELTTLRSRMGELRMGSGQSGAWIRAYGNKYVVSDSSGVGYKQNQQGLTFGADAPLPVGDGQWLAGLMAGYSKSDLDLDQGTSGTVNSYYAGAYTTWLDAQTGYYFDGVVKVNRFQNKSDVSLSDNTSTNGRYNNYGVGASAEFGRHVKFDKGYFLEPYAQVSSVVIQGKHYDLDNGLRAEGDRTRSLLGEVGSTAGRSFELASGQTVQPYVRVAYLHEFSKNNEVKVNDNVFNNDLSGSRGKLGAGMTMTLNQKIKLYADLEYSKGDNVEQPLGGSVGLHYSW